MKNFLILFLSVVSVGIVFSQDTNTQTTASPPIPKAKVRVKITVDGKDEIKAVVMSYVQRELRKIDDIEIVNNNAIINIGCVVLEFRDRNSRHFGYGLSFVVTSEVKNRATIFGIATSNLSEKEKNGLYVELKEPNTGNLSNHFLVCCDDDTIEKECGKCISNIDGSDINDVRILFRAVNDIDPKTAK